MNGAPMCSRCRTRIVGDAELSPQRDLFGEKSYVHAGGACPSRDPVAEILVRRDLPGERDAVRFRRMKLEARAPRPRLTRHPLGGGL